ncbi:MAG: class I SAM-dependent methyltransferase, partial [Nocardiopsaceae bacterium]|nr:class I SAM-dependent methyltransferase [Nocardiopsaceae bacterium]
MTDSWADWPDALAQAGFQSGLPTAWLAEGLVYSFPAETASAFIDRVAAVAAPGSQSPGEVARVDAPTEREPVEDGTTLNQLARLLASVPTAFPAEHAEGAPDPHVNAGQGHLLSTWNGMGDCGAGG